ncbi:hypothetical protein BN2476_40041 [Paraburkholderia piptadeniae]|uniref:Uncharacterized protein n=1 Tax=Paraburkholderia piptadeniae TaxID=1701573 RepID=A0A1N7RK54_9BURK|nr:hypothetical protein BN2476_40041 [Paraburkholderia piptadeniae]
MRFSRWQSGVALESDWGASHAGQYIPLLLREKNIRMLSNPNAAAVPSTDE